MQRDRHGSPDAVRCRRALRLVGVAFAVAAAAAGAAPRSLAADHPVAVVVVPTFAPETYAGRGAVGLVVPGTGGTVSREKALAALVRGRVASSRADLDGNVILKLAKEPAETTVYVALPPPGSHDNVVRYPVAIVGPGYRGVLTSDSTRIDGLVSLADIAPTASAVAAGETPPIRSRVDAHAAATLERLDARLTRAQDARTGANVALVGWLVAFAVVGIVGRSSVAGRAAVLAAPAALAAALVLRAAGVDDPTAVVAALAVATGGGALLLAVRASFLVPAVVGFLLAFLVTLAVRPEVNALAALGPQSSRGSGRFYGVTNRVETLLLAPSLAAAALAGLVAAVAIGLLLLATVGWSRAGADGGGLLVVGSSFAILLAGLARVRLTPARIAAGAAVVVALGLAFVGLDALLGGTSHVTRAVGDGPGGLLDDLDRRVRISWAGSTSSGSAVLLCLASLAGLAWIGVRGRHRPVITAMLVAIGASLLVNDTPVDVLCFGALGCLALTAWDETRSREETTGR